MAKHVSIDWSSVVGYRITENILDYINQLGQEATELISKRVELDTSSDVNRTGLFLKPGILSDVLYYVEEGDVSSNPLGIYVEELGDSDANLHIYPGKAVTYRGQIIELDSEVTIYYENKSVLENKTVILRYETQDSDEVPAAQTYHPVTGATAIPVKMKTFDVELVDYAPETDPYLNALAAPFDGNYVPIGKIIASTYGIDYENGHRRIALVSIPWLGFGQEDGWGHWSGEFVDIDNFNDRFQWNLFNFLACKGSQDRTRNNQLGLTPEDIGFNWSHLYISHSSGFSNWPTNSLATSLLGSLLIEVAPISIDEWVYLVDKRNYFILTHSDVPLSMVFDAEAASLANQHYYLLRFYSDDPDVPTFALEAVDLGDTEVAAITSLRDLYTQRHKEDAPGGVGWIGLAVFRYSSLAPVLILTGSSFSDDFWLKDSGGNHQWNMYRWFQATTTTTTDIVHDGYSKTPYPPVINPTSWWTPGSKLLRDLIDYIFETIVPESDFDTHKNGRCDGSTSDVKTAPAIYSQHWADVIRLYGSTPPYFSDLYSVDWSQQCGRSIDRLFSKLNDLRRIKRPNKEYQTENPPAGTVKDGFPLGAVNRYAYWASQIATEDTLGGEVENQYILNTLLNNERMLEHEALTVLELNDSGLLGRNENIVAVSAVPDSTKVLVVRVQAVLVSGGLIGVNIYCWLRERNDLGSIDWITADFADSDIPVETVTGFLRFEPSMKIVWYQSGNDLYFYFNVDALGWDGSNSYVGSLLRGYKYSSDASFTEVTIEGPSHAGTVASTDLRNSVRVNDLLVVQDISKLFYTYPHVHIPSRIGIYPKVYTIESDGDLVVDYHGGAGVYENIFSSSLFWDGESEKVFLVAVYVSLLGGSLVSFKVWNDGVGWDTCTPGADYCTIPGAPSGDTYSPLVYANRFGFYIGYAYHATPDTTYGIAYMQRYANGSLESGFYSKFWRRPSDGFLLPELRTVEGGTDVIVVAYNRIIDCVNMLPSGRSSLLVPMSRVDLVGGIFSSGSRFENPVVLPTTGRGRDGISGETIHWPSWTVANGKGTYPYLSAKDYIFVAVGWHPEDEKLRLISFQISPWRGFDLP